MNYSIRKENKREIPPLPAAAGAIQGPDSIIQGGFIELSVSSIDGADTYRWYLDGKEIRNDESQTLTATKAGIYKVAGVNAAGEGEHSPNHTVKWIEEPKAPAKAGEIQGPDGLFEGESIELTIAAIEGADTYCWYMNDEEVRNDTSR